MIIRPATPILKPTRLPRQPAPVRFVATGVRLRPVAKPTSAQTFRLGQRGR